MFLGTIGVGLLENMLAGKIAKTMIQGREGLWEGKGKNSAGQDFLYHLILWLIFISDDSFGLEYILKI